MKAISLTILFAVLCTSYSFAAPTDLYKAEEIAKQYLKLDYDGARVLDRYDEIAPLQDTIGYRGWSTKLRGSHIPVFVIEKYEPLEFSIQNNGLIRKAIKFYVVGLFTTDKGFWEKQYTTKEYLPFMKYNGEYKVIDEYDYPPYISVDAAIKLLEKYQQDKGLAELLKLKEKISNQK